MDIQSPCDRWPKDGERDARDQNESIHRSTLGVQHQFAECNVERQLPSSSEPIDTICGNEHVDALGGCANDVFNQV